MCLCVQREAFVIHSLALTQHSVVMAHAEKYVRVMTGNSKYDCHSWSMMPTFAPEPRKRQKVLKSKSKGADEIEQRRLANDSPLGSRFCPLSFQAARMQILAQNPSIRDALISLSRDFSLTSNL